MKSFRIFQSTRAELPFFANESAVEREDGVGLLVANEYQADADPKENWVQLSPFGTFPNAAGKQVFNSADSEAICNEFRSLTGRLAAPVGLPFYIGHPDHPAFKEFYTDASAKGRIKELQTRHDASCAHCSDFANEKSDQPCRKHGLFGRVKWNADGKALIANESFHGHSVNWQMHREGDGWHPHYLKSVGFTNEPGIPVPAITAANQKQPMAKTFLETINQLLGQNFANEEDAENGVKSMCNTHKATSEAYTKLQGDHDALTKTHGDLVGQMSALTKAFGANEAVDAAVAPLFTAEAKRPDADLVPFLANEVATLRTAVASHAALGDVEAAKKIVTDTGLHIPEGNILPFLANEFAAGRKNLATVQTKVADALKTLLVAGGFSSKKEADELAKEFANEAQFVAAVEKASALKPKYRVTSGLAPLAEKSADMMAAANEKADNVNSLVTMVNERLTKNAKDKVAIPPGTSAYDYAFAQVTSEQPELLAKMKKPQ